MKNTGKKSGFEWKKLKKSVRIYIVYAGVLLALCVAFLVYSACIVSEYDKAQPERAVEAEIVRIKAAIAGDGIESYMSIYQANSKYEGLTDEEFSEKFNTALKNAAEITYELDTGAGEGLEKTFYLSADGKHFAKVTLEGSNNRTKLFFFSMADWKVKNVTPISIGCTDYKIYVPSLIGCTVNGVAVSGDSDGEKDGVSYYNVSIPEDADIRFVKADGTSVSYYYAGGEIKPALYNYRLSLSRDIKVKSNGKNLTGKADENGNYQYEILSMTNPEVILTDGLGNEKQYSGEADLGLNGFAIEVPDNFTVSVGGKALSDEGITTRENPASAELANYMPDVKLNSLKTYSVSSFAENIKITVTDNLGRENEYELECNKRFSISNQHGADDVPDEIKSQINPLNFALDWSKFMTNDLTFAEISKYFAKDSTYYKEANTWVSNIDHTFTSNHTAPAFSDEKVCDYVEYGENCFSVHVSFTKTLHLVRTGQDETDEFDMIIYFVKTDGNWIVAVKHDA